MDTFLIIKATLYFLIGIVTYLLYRLPQKKIDGEAILLAILWPITIVFQIGVVLFLLIKLLWEKWI